MTLLKLFTDLNACLSGDFSQKTKISEKKWIILGKSGEMCYTDRAGETIGKETVFRGINAINIDAKGRLGIPTRYRQRLSDAAGRQLVVTIDTEEACLLLYPTNEWEKIESKIEALPSFNKTTRRIQRLLLGHATEVEMDGSGRILLPTLLREYASLDKSVILLGQGKKFEIWDESKWQVKRDTWLGEGLDDELPDQLGSIAL